MQLRTRYGVRLFRLQNRCISFTLDESGRAAGPSPQPAIPPHHSPFSSRHERMPVLGSVQANSSSKLIYKLRSQDVLRTPSSHPSIVCTSDGTGKGSRKRRGEVIQLISLCPKSRRMVSRDGSQPLTSGSWMAAHHIPSLPNLGTPWSLSLLAWDCCNSKPFKFLYPCNSLSLHKGPKLSLESFPPSYALRLVAPLEPGAYVATLGGCDGPWRWKVRPARLTCLCLAEGHVCCPVNNKTSLQFPRSALRCVG